MIWFTVCAQYPHAHFNEGKEGLSVDMYMQPTPRRPAIQCYGLFPLARLALVKLQQYSSAQNWQLNSKQVDDIWKTALFIRRGEYDTDTVQDSIYTTARVFRDTITIQKTDHAACKQVRHNGSTNDGSGSSTFSSWGVSRALAFGVRVLGKISLMSRQSFFPCCGVSIFQRWTSAIYCCPFFLNVGDS